jgi:hypothetical protein
MLGRVIDAVNDGSHPKIFVGYCGVFLALFAQAYYDERLNTKLIRQLTPKKIPRDVCKAEK